MSNKDVEEIVLDVVIYWNSEQIKVRSPVETSKMNLCDAFMSCQA